MSLIIHCMMMDDDNDNDTHHTSNTNPTSIHEHESLKNMIMIREKKPPTFFEEWLGLDGGWTT